MKQLEKWWDSVSAKYFPNDRGAMFSRSALAEDAFRAGMLEAAEIAERMYFHHTPDDGVISGDGIAAEIRKRAE